MPEIGPRKQAAEWTGQALLALTTHSLVFAALCHLQEHPA